MSISTPERPAAVVPAAAPSDPADVRSAQVATAVTGQGPVRGEVAALTGLRLVAALWVVGFHFHFTALPGVDAVAGALGPLVTHGALGVDLFFVLSGFVIAWTYLDQLGPRLRAGEAGRFLWARVARMWPAYAVVFHLFGVWLVARAVLGDTDQVAYQAVQPSLGAGAWLEQLVGVQLWTEPFLDGASWVGPTWSISAEWLAYLLFPLLAVGFFRLRNLPFGVLAAGSLLCTAPLAAAFVVVGSPYYPYSWLVRILGGFAAGVLAMLAVRRLRGRDVAAGASAVATVAALGVPVVLVAGAVHGRGLHGLAVLLFPVLVGALALADRGPVHHLLTRRPVLHGGRISYALYLVHIPLFEVFWFLSDSGVLPAGGETGHLIALTVFVGTLPVAHLLYSLVERPARRWLRALPGRRAAAPEPGGPRAARHRPAEDGIVHVGAVPAVDSHAIAPRTATACVSTPASGVERIGNDIARRDPETCVLPVVADADPMPTGEPSTEALPVVAAADRAPAGESWTEALPVRHPAAAPPVPRPASAPVSPCSAPAVPQPAVPQPAVPQLAVPRPGRHAAPTGDAPVPPTGDAPPVPTAAEAPVPATADAPVPATADGPVPAGVDGRVPAGSAQWVLDRLAAARAAGVEGPDGGAPADLVGAARLRSGGPGTGGGLFTPLVDGPGSVSGVDRMDRVERLRSLRAGSRPVQESGAGEDAAGGAVATESGVVPAPRAIRSAAALPGTRSGVEHCGRAARRRDDAHSSAATPIVAASGAAARRRRTRPAHGA